jgi:ligand-binding sensor domain-containing protein
MKKTRHLILLCVQSLIFLVGSAEAYAAAETANIGANAPSAADAGLPYVYTNWEQLTIKEGLPNDHIFAVRADKNYVWIGTENGLARYDKRTRKIKSWQEKDGLPWKVITGIEVNLKTGEVWLALFGGGLARFSGGRFDHFHQLNSGLVNDVVYAVAMEHDNVWCATTAGASRFDPNKDKWTIFTEKNSPMEEIWNYNVCYNDGLVCLAVWGSGVLEYNVATEQWKDYLDPDGEMEIDLYRDDGIVHVITTGASYVEKVLWVSTYFGCCRYDGRHWRGYYDHDCGLPSNFTNNLKGRSANEAWFCTDKGVGVCADFETDTWVAYTSDGKNHTGKAVIKRAHDLVGTVDTGYNVPHNFIICMDFDGSDVWVGTSKGLGHGTGNGYYPRLRPAGATTALK